MRGFLVIFVHETVLASGVRERGDGIHRIMQIGDGLGQVLQIGTI